VDALLLFSVILTCWTAHQRKYRSDASCLLSNP
jgi:hypothetical protein